MTKVDPSLCVACGDCAEVCPKDAITIDGICVIDADACVHCGLCIDECPSGALSE